MIENGVWHVGRNGESAELHFADTRLLLHRHIDEPGAVFLTCYAVDIDTCRLGAGAVLNFRDEALAFVRVRLTKLLNALPPKEPQP